MIRRLIAVYRSRRAERAENARIDKYLREMFATPTEPIDIVDGPFDRADREVHGMTASELTELNRKFKEITGPEWPNQT